MKKLHLFLSAIFVWLLFNSSGQTAIDFNGSNQYTLTNLNASVSQFTVEMDIYPKGGDATFDRMFSMNTWDYFDIAIDAAGTVRIISSPAGVGWTTATTLPLNTYSHLAVVYQSSQILIFVNGNQVNTIGCGGTTFNIPQFSLGSTMGIFSQSANVRIDNFRFWDIARTNPEVLANYQLCLTGSEANLMVLYDFDEGTGTVANDLATFLGANNATANNGAPWVTGMACIACEDNDFDGFTTCDGDCNDSDASIFPGAPELCDGLDNDCDGIVLANEVDNDGDGVMACADCDDNDSNNFPGGTEICDGLDNNCDGAADNGIATSTYYADNDGDGYGDPSSTIVLCSVIAGYVADNTDCDDNNSNVFPGNTEICDGIDNNCDGQVDEVGIIDQTIQTVNFSEFCSADTIIDLTSSQSEFLYYLRDDANDSIITGPVAGTGSALSLNTDLITATTTFNVFASTPTYALEFDGTDDMITVADDPLLDLTSVISIEAWIKPSANSGVQSVVSKSSDIQNTGYIFPRSDDGWNNFNAYLHIGGTWRVVSAPYPTDGDWHHLAMTYDGAIIRIYQDGIEVNNLAIAGTIAVNNNDLTFGNQTGNSEYYGGTVDDIRIWNITRSQSEIQSNMSTCLSGSEAGLVAYYDMENGPGATTTDKANALDGILQNMDNTASWVLPSYDIWCAACWGEMTDLITITIDPINDQSLTNAFISATCSADTTIELSSSQLGVEYYLRDDANDSIIDGPVSGTGSALLFETGGVNSTTTYNVVGNVYSPQGSALEFDGIDDHVVLGTPGDLHFDGTTPFTLEAWSYRVSGGQQDLITNYSSATNEGYRLVAWASRVMLRLKNGAGNTIDVRANGVLTADNWHHIAVSYDGSQLASGIKIYVDGVQVSFDVYDDSFSGPISTGSQIPLLGASDFDYYEGRIGETRIWSTERTPIEIANNYMNCLTGSESNLEALYKFDEGSGMSLTDLSAGSHHGVLTNMDATAWGSGPTTCPSIKCSNEMTALATVSINPIADLPIAITNTGLCPGNSGTTVTVASSEIGVDYFLRDDTNDTIVDGPITGDGNTIVLNTGGVNSNMVYNVFAQTGNPNMALQFDGVDDHMAFDASTIPDYGATKTIEFWLNSPADGRLLGYPGSYMHYHSGGGGSIEWNETFMGWPQTIGLGILGDGNWHHIAVTYDGSDARMYVDGVLETTHNYTTFGPAAGATAYLGTDENFSNYAGAGTTLDEFRVWNVARTEAEIAGDMNAVGLPHPNITVYYGFDNVSGNTVSDVSGNGSPGTLISTDPTAIVANSNLSGTSCELEMTTTVSVALNTTSTSTDVVSTCDSYTWIDGNTYTASNNSATHVLTNAQGCDSTVTLDLTINNTTTGTDVIAACDSYTWLDGNIYTSSNNTATWIETNAVGCDSVVTLDLTITNSSTGTDIQSACDSYTWLDGNTYTSSNNTATWIETNAVGCDSVVTLDLTITNSSTGTDVQSACDSYTWLDGNTYTSSNNTATWIETNAAGCDSTVTLDLTINPLPDNGVTQTGSLLEADQVGAIYQWIDCDDNNAVISGETNQGFTPTPITGNYAVEITLSGCTDTSSCYLVDYTGIDEYGNLTFVLYPNPTKSGEFTVRSEGGIKSIKVLDLMGREIELPMNVQEGIVDGSKLESGKYIVRVRTNEDAILQQEIVVIK